VFRTTVLHCDDVINSRHLGFGETGSRSIRSAVPQKPYPRIKHEVDRAMHCRDMTILNAKLDDVINDVTTSESTIRDEY